MKTQAAILTGIGSEFSLADIDIDEPRPDEVLVQIEAVGLCHTDLVARDGGIPIAFPGVVGHEGAGTVLAVGSGVTSLAPGDKVAITFNHCGECGNCVSGHESYCERFAELNYGGVRADGSTPLSLDGQTVGGMFFGQSSFARAALANQRNVVKVDAKIPFELLAPLGCGVQTGVGAVMRSLAAEKGSSIVIAGGGSVGLSAVLGAVIQECATIVVVEPQAARRALALELGATHAIDPADGDLVEQIGAVLPGGTDYVVDTTGIPAVVESLIDTCAIRATVGLVGLPGDPAAAISLGFFTALGLGLTITGILEGDSSPDDFIPQLVELHEQGRLPLEKLVRTFPFASINDAVRAQHDGEVVKAVLTFADEG